MRNAFTCNIKEMIGYEAGEVMRSGEIANTSPTATVYKKNLLALNKYHRQLKNNPLLLKILV